MLTRDDLQKLFARPDRTMTAVFTLYLNVASGDYRQKLQRMLDEQSAAKFDHFEAVHLLAAVQEVEQFFATYQPRAQSLVFIFDRIDRFLWTRDLQVPLRDMVHLSVRPYLRPLAEAMDESPHYGVAVVERKAFDCSPSRLAILRNTLRRASTLSMRYAEWRGRNILRN